MSGICTDAAYLVAAAWPVLNTHLALAAAWCRCPHLIALHAHNSLMRFCIAAG
jgi:hypothetical protein